jgi:hypothetical protein
MLQIETKEIKISEELKRKIEMICRFTNTKPIIKNGSIRNIKGTNIVYAEPHQIFIKDNMYLIYDESDIVFINNLYNSIYLKDLENYIKQN